MQIIQWIVAACFAAFPLCASMNYWEYAICINVFIALALFGCKRTSPFPVGVAVLALSYFALFFFNSDWSSTPDQSGSTPVVSSLFFLSALLPAGLIFGAHAAADSEFASKAICCSSIAGAVLGLLGITVDRDVLGDGRYQLAGNLCAIGTISSIVLCSTRKKPTTLAVFLACLLLSFLGVMYYGSKQAAVALIATTLSFSLFCLFGQNRHRKTGVIILVGVATLLLFITFSTQQMNFMLLHRISAMGDTEFSGVAGTRLSVQANAWAHADFLRPMGLGTGSIANDINGFAGGHAHNIVIEAAVEHGAVGLLLLVIPVLYFSVIGLGNAISRTKLDATILWLYFLSGTCFSMLSGDLPTARFFWLYFFTLAVVQRSYGADLKSPKEDHRSTLIYGIRIQKHSPY
jgi:hypothetical protein